MYKNLKKNYRTQTIVDYFMKCCLKINPYFIFMKKRKNICLFIR